MRSVISRPISPCCRRTSALGLLAGLLINGCSSIGAGPGNSGESASIGGGTAGHGGAVAPLPGAGAQGGAGGELDGGGRGGAGGGGVRDHPCGADTGLTLLFFDGFESGDKTHAENGVAWASGTKTEVSDHNPLGGTYSLKFTFSGQPDGGDAFAEQRVRLGADYGEILVELAIYIPDGTEAWGGAAYAHRDSSGPDNNKLIRLWKGDPDDTNNGYSHYFVKLGASFNVSHQAEGISLSHNEYGTNQGGVGPFGSNGDGPYATGVDPMIATADRGSWITLRFRARTASESNDDGVMQVWKNGALVHDAQNLPIFPTGGVGNAFDFGYLLGWANSGFDATTYLFVDDVKICGT